MFGIYSRAQSRIAYVNCADGFFGCFPDRSQYVLILCRWIVIHLFYELSFLLSAGGNHLKKTIIKNGKPTVVPDYATVRNTFYPLSMFRSALD